NAPLKDAMVTFEIQESVPNSGPYHDFTDEHGSYRKDFSGLDKSSGMVVHAQAKGFEEVKPFVFAALVEDNRHDFILLPLPAAHPSQAHPSAAHPSASPAPAPTPHPEVLIHPPEFIRKMAVDAIRVHLQKR